MSHSTLPQVNRMEIPSDQDASGRTLGQEEMRLLCEAVRTGTLTSTKGTFVKSLETEFSKCLGVDHTFACASGTAAVHAAVAAINPEPGEEIITSPITDMGALAPILYQGAIPVFADVDTRTCNVTAETIRPRLSSRTRAIVVTHLFGNPCEMGPILALASSHNIPVIEDCAQAFLARYSGRQVGTLGAIGCFSLQQGKHITTGEGGLVTTSDARLARRIFLFINKAWGYGDPEPDHYFLALNYRMSELQGAVGVAQLPKLEFSVARRIATARDLTERLQGLPGIGLPWVNDHSVHTYWKYCLRVDSDLLPGGALGLGRILKEKGIHCAPRYIQKPAFMCEIFQKQNTFGTSRYPFSLATPEAVNYDSARFPKTFEALHNILVLPWNELYTEEHVAFLADSICEAVAQLCSSNASGS
jgi:perosamine synthetase